MKLLALFFIFIIVTTSVQATAVSVTIYGTNRSNAQTNITCEGCNNSIYVNAWNTSYVKNITVNSSNASGDVISFNISNVTAYQVQELKVNGTVVNGYQAGANGMLNFSYNVTGNKTLLLSPAENKGGLNFTWAQFVRPIVYSANQSNISIVKQPNGSYAINLTLGVPAAGGGFSKVVNVTTTYAAATVYQNTNATSMVMTISTQGSAWSYCYSDAINPPTVRTAWWVTGSATIIILPNDFYKCDWSGGAHNNWILWS